MLTVILFLLKIWLFLSIALIIFGALAVVVAGLIVAFRGY